MEINDYLEKTTPSNLGTFRINSCAIFFLTCLQWLSTQQDTLVTQSQLARQSSLDKMVVSETAQKSIPQSPEGDGSENRLEAHLKVV